MDDGRTPDHGHPISSPCEPNGSGELKRCLHMCICETLLGCPSGLMDSIFPLQSIQYKPDMLQTAQIRFILFFFHKDMVMKIF